MPENPASYRVVRTKSYLFNKADLQLTQLRQPWVATKASCKSKKGWKSRG
ncbi:hypothetical protein ACLHXY_23240 [Klebsiella quasipneumoniae]